MLQSNVLEPLISLLSSNTPDVRMNTCQAIIRLASDARIAEVILRIGLDQDCNEIVSENLKARVDISR